MSSIPCCVFAESVVRPFSRRCLGYASRNTVSTCWRRSASSKTTGLGSLEGGKPSKQSSATTDLGSLGASRPPKPSSSSPPRPRPSRKQPPSKPHHLPTLPFKSTPSKTPSSKSSPPSHASPHPSNKQPMPELLRGSRWIGIIGAGAIALCLGAFTASLAMSQRAERPVYITGHEPCIPTGRPAIQSPLEFDQHLDKAEWRFGITKLRKRIAREASGHVLEVAMGAGRNLEFFDWDGLMTAARLVSPEERRKRLLEKSEWGRQKMSDVRAREMESFTGVDISGSMLDLGLKRVRQFVPHGTDEVPEDPAFEKLARKQRDGLESISLLRDHLRILKQDAQDSLPPAPGKPGRKYDTILQTFGLCSVHDPVKLLANMAAVLQPDTGRILLVEHGRSNWFDMVNGILDRAAREHFERFGCWWNRDIQLIVDEAVEKTPGLEVVKFERPGWFTFGTHVWVELRVKDVETGEEGKREGAGLAKTDWGNRQEKEKSWWGSWFRTTSVLSSPKSREDGGDENKR